LAETLQKFRRTAWILVLLGPVGLFGSVELLIQKINLLANPDYVLNCDINPVLSCGSVIITDQASAFGFPNPILGVIGFTAVIAFGVFLLVNFEPPNWMWIALQLGATLAMAFVIWLFIQSLYVIGALCPWCMVVWAVTIPIFWQVTVENIKNNVYGTRLSFLSWLIPLKSILVVATYLILIGLIYIRWADFWLS
jgi:uncharacterized membrane protein